ncbi:unnamed protein product [Arctia plantaginis]|uniref:Arginine kinase n=1 Tax=Arctia plantaginis TaxID=874455 RepID=A0A8S0ZQV1_ARCPL|nr:unnamed protein product [Arctia plantaginis]
MESVKKWLTERTAKKNGIYVHYSPPKVVGVVSAAQLRQWARGGVDSRLERAVLAGQGRRLLAEAEAMHISSHLTHLVAKCDALHAAVERGSLLDLQVLLELLESDYNRRKYVMCRDEASVGLLHKAVYYDFMDIAAYLVKNYPQLVHQKDSEGRTPLHYTVLCRDEAGAASLLEGAGAARAVRDAAGRTPAHYRGTARELLVLPDTAMARDNKNAPGLVIKRHNIRIWCHDCDMVRLQRVVWEGHGSRLLSEVSNQHVVKRFLEAVPYIMNTIRDIHNDVIQNDLESLMKHAGDPVPPQALSSRDPNFMTVLHKAAGLGHGGILKYIVERYPQGINDVDNDGRTPLHYAASVRDEQHTYNTLVSLGADESVVDNKNRTPGYYVNRPQDVDKNNFKILPDAPRTPSSAYPSSWDWKLLDTEVIAELNKKSRRRHLKASNENISSKDTNTVSDTTDNQTGGMKGSSTHEHINSLPELDDAKQTKDDIENRIANVESNKESEVDENNEDQNNLHLLQNNEEEQEAESSNVNAEEPNNDVEEVTADTENNTERKEDTKNIKKENNEIEEEDKEKEEKGNEKEETNEKEEANEDEKEEANEEEEEANEKKDGDEKEEKNEEHNKMEEEKDTKKEEEEDNKEEEDSKEGEDNKEGDKSNEVDDSKEEKDNKKDEEIVGELLKDHIHTDTNTNEIVDRLQQELEQAEVKSKNENEHEKDYDERESIIGQTRDTTEEQLSRNINMNYAEGNDKANEETANVINFIAENEETRHIKDNSNRDNEGITVEHNSLSDDHPEHEEHDLSDTETKDNKSHASIENKSDKVAEDDATTNEGNNNGEHNEDDDDVQVQGETNSEYSDSNLKSTAELFDLESAKRGNVSNGRSTQESLIEGLVSADAEQDSQDASMTQREESVHGEVLVVDNEIDPEVTDLINNANMEMLATLVLNGEGSRLIGRHSRNSELQAFLDNVPTYMQKINKVHIAAREGNIRDLQAALDRRKFAIARDPISPNGATPLHVATIFGKTNIMKYLGGRFPETLSAVDFEGRTALHYAAVLPDNGHYYNLLQQLGANSKDLDDNGRSAEDYQKNPAALPFDQLLSDYGISADDVQNMFSDKVPEDHVSSRRILEAPEALDTLDRCYRLLASAKPVRTPLSASSNRATPPLVLGRFLKKHVFDSIKYRVTKLDHDLFDVIWPAVKKLPDNRNIVQTVEEDFPGGITAPDYYVYKVFHEFLMPLIKDLHNININSELPIHPKSDFLQSSSAKLSKEPLVELNFDPNDEFILSGSIECARNLEGFELPLNLKVGKLETIERIVTTILMQEEFSKFCEQTNPESDQKGGTYYTLNEVMEKPSEICATLASSGLLIALCDREDIDDSMRLHGRHWPYGRGVFVSDDKSVAVWINVHDHIRILVSTPQESPGEVGLPFSKLSYIMTYLHEKLDFVFDVKLGHLSARPTYLGAAIRFSLIVNFPGLSKDPDNMKHLCAMRGLQYRETLSTDIARISNYQCLGITEGSCFHDFGTAASNLLHLEKDLSMQNSAHIATMLSNIFRRKRSSLTGQESPEKKEKL